MSIWLTATLWVLVEFELILAWFTNYHLLLISFICVLNCDHTSHFQGCVWRRFFLIFTLSFFIISLILHVCVQICGSLWLRAKTRRFWRWSRRRTVFWEVNRIVVFLIILRHLASHSGIRSFLFPLAPVARRYWHRRVLFASLWSISSYRESAEQILVTVFKFSWASITYTLVFLTHALNHTHMTWCLNFFFLWGLGSFR